MGSLLDDYLSRKRLSVSEVARRSGVSKSYLSMIAHGQRRSLSFRVLSRLAEELELSPTELGKRIQNGLEHPAAPAGNDEGASSERANSGRNDSEETFSGELFAEALEQALNARHNNDVGELERLCGVIGGMDEVKAPLKQNFLWWHEALKLAWQNRFDDSLVSLEKAGNFRPTSRLQRRFKAKIIGDIGSVYVAKCNYQQALKRLRLSLILWDEGEQAAVIHLNMGTLFRRAEIYQNAIESYEKAVKMGSAPLKLLAYSGLGQVYMDKGNMISARQCLLQGYALSRSLASDLHKGDIFCNLGKYYKEIGKVDRAISLLKKAADVAGNYGNMRTKLYAMMELADAHIRKDHLREADQILAIVEEELVVDGGDVLLVGSCLTTIAKKCLSLGQSQESLLVLNRCYLILSGFSPTVELATCCDLLRESYIRVKMPQEAQFFESELKRIRRLLKYRSPRKEQPG